MVEINNTGHSGLAITQIHLWNEISARIDQETVNNDDQAATVVTSMVNVTECIYKLGKLIQSNDTTVRIHDYMTNNKQPHTFGSTVLFMKDDLSRLCNNMMLIGEVGLTLAETMYGYCQLIDRELVDEWAWGFAKGAYTQMCE